MKMLQEVGLSPGQITEDALKQYLPDNEFYRVSKVSDCLRHNDAILVKCGLGYPVLGSNTLSERIVNESQDQDQITINQKYNITNTLLKAVCRDKESIVLWEDKDNLYNTNDMFKQSMLNIVTAMQAVWLFEEL